MNIDSLQVVTEGGYKKIVALRPYRRGQVICPLPHTSTFDKPDRYTVQIGQDMHIGVGIFSSLNHSCDPNVVLDTDSMLVIAWRDIAAGDELAFFYPSTEWDMAEPFLCNCGSPECLGLIRGAKYLPAAVFEKYFINQHIMNMFAVIPSTVGQVKQKLHK
jgi:hypothetical protein